jgi:hypothetical protein
MVEAALAPLHIKGGSPCEYPHTRMALKFLCGWMLVKDLHQSYLLAQREHVTNPGPQVSSL